ncbi:MAG TPA: FIST N-terminal domain-containing protein, partial [Actinoplanes sp.]|nr:FIST N-terminal domain-containing protein [Actinoplanes sp.]
VYSSPGYDLQRLLDGVRAQAVAGTAIVGCTTLGEVVPAAADPTADGVVVVALGGPGFEIRTAVGRDVSTRRREAGMDAVAGLAGLTSAYRAGVLLCDGLVGEQHEVVRGAYAVVGAVVPLVGGCAGDDLSYSRTHQFFGDRDGVEVLTDAVVGVGLGSDAKLGIGISHGWQKVGEPMIVTRSSGGRLYELDGDPALDVYLARIGADRSIFEDLKAFRPVAFGSPLGLSRRTGEDIRVVHDGDTTDGSLLCLADIPQGALAWVMGAEDASMIKAGADSCEQAIRHLDGADPAGVLVFDCGARKVMLGPDGIRREIDAMASVTAGAPMAGFYTYGEFARTHGARGMHHLTVVTLAFA